MNRHSPLYVPVKLAGCGFSGKPGNKDEAPDHREPTTTSICGTWMLASRFHAFAGAQRSTRNPAVAVSSRARSPQPGVGGGSAGLDGTGLLTLTPQAARTELRAWRGIQMMPGQPRRSSRAPRRTLVVARPIGRTRASRRTRRPSGTGDRGRKRRGSGARPTTPQGRNESGWLDEGKRGADGCDLAFLPCRFRGRPPQRGAVPAPGSAPPRQAEDRPRIRASRWRPSRSLTRQLGHPGGQGPIPGTSRPPAPAPAGSLGPRPALRGVEGDRASGRRGERSTAPPVTPGNGGNAPEHSPEHPRSRHDRRDAAAYAANGERTRRRRARRARAGARRGAAAG